jgi:hypothetical protein
MIKMAKVVNGALEILRPIRKMEAAEKNPCELEEARYDAFTVVRVSQGKK